MTRAQFLERFGRFKTADTGLVDAKLAEAALQINEDVYGQQANAAHGYLTAHLLAIDDLTESARLQPRNAKVSRDDALTVYEREYKRIQRQVAYGFRVMGSASGATE